MISIIIPIYNSERYLEKCIKSVLNQTYTNFELILINDGSTDGSKKICEFFKNRDSRIIFINQKNRGVSHARNIGIDKATGKYITFIDSDDWINKKYLEILLKKMETENLDLSICGIQRIDGIVLKEECSIEDITINLDIKYLDTIIELNKKFLLYGPVVKLYRKEVIKVNTEIRFPKDLSFGEDLIFNFKYLKYCNKIGIVKESFYYYRIGEEKSLSQKYHSNKYEIDMLLFGEIYNFFETNKLITEESNEFLFHRLFWNCYDNLFLINHSQCHWRFLKKYKYVKSIMNNPKFRESLDYFNRKNGIKFIVFLIKFKLGMSFLFINKLLKIKIKKNKF